MLQITDLFPEIYKLHEVYGSKSCEPVFGAGRVNRPRLCLVFMNPTARNVSATKEWNGIRAPWLGTKKVWGMLYKIGILKNKDMVDRINLMKPSEWNEEFAFNLYSELAKESIYITNIAKCTQDDARPLSNLIYRQYLSTTLKELKYIEPEFTFCFGNQVSSVILGKNISVSKYSNDEYENLDSNGKLLKIYPTFYPVGQGMRNMPKAIERINKVIGN